MVSSSRARGYWLLALSVLATLSLGLAFVDAHASATSHGESDPQSVARKIFSHKDHVRTGWVDKEYPRDCRTCHDFAAGKEAADTCSTCHLDKLTIEGSVAAEKRNIQNARPEWAGILTFDHKTHLELDCGLCHANRQPNGRPSRIKVSDDFTIPKGLGVCLDCHDPKANSPRFADGRRKATSAQGNQMFMNGMNGHPSMNSTGAELFRHADHLTEQALRSGDLKACNICHASMSADGARPEIGDDLFKKDDCAQCHKGETQPLPVAVKIDQKAPSGSDWTFFHNDHMTQEALSKMGSYPGQACFKCHEYVANPGAAQEEYPLRKDFETYPKCIECHQRAKASDDIAKDLGDHGAVDNCFGCHQIGLDVADINMATNRPTRTMTRRDPLDWRFRAHAHPHVTGEPKFKSKECAECHVSERPELPSRLRQKTFAHGPHMAKGQLTKATPENCIECHTLPADNAFMQQAMAKDGHLNYDTESCMTCHREVGAQEIKPIGFRSRDSVTVLFDHADHYKADGSVKIACTECHVHQLNDKGDLEFQTPEDVMDCRKCHNHGEYTEQTGGKDRAYVQTCMVCHEKGVPEIGAPLYLERHIVEGLKGMQWHPNPSAADGSCALCHLNVTQTVISRDDLKSVQSVYGSKIGSGVHPTVSQGQEACAGCHWHKETDWHNNEKRNKAKIRALIGPTVTPIRQKIVVR